MANKNKSAEPEKDPTAAPGWALTFGDLMTQLLTFFILLFSISEVKEEKIYEVFESFRTHFSTDEVAHLGYTLRSLHDTLKVLSQEKPAAPSNKKGMQGNNSIEVSERFSKDVKVKKVEEGIMVSLAGETFFEPESETLREMAKEYLESLARDLAGSRQRIKIMGHTSPFPLKPNSDFPDHFELGYRRAKAVADFFQGTWKSMGHPEEKDRLEISSRGIFDPPDSGLDTNFDRVEIIVTPDWVVRADKKGFL